jgi:hypothetical protein
VYRTVLKGLKGGGGVAEGQYFVAVGKRVLATGYSKVQAGTYNAGLRICITFANPNPSFCNAVPDLTFHYNADLDLAPHQRNMQCCGSGSGIRCLFDPWIRDPNPIFLRV